MNSKPTITISAPIRNRSWVLPYYLDHINRISYPKNRINILWIVNQSIDQSEEILYQFKNKYEHEYNKIEIIKYKSKKHLPEYDRKTIRKAYIGKNGIQKVEIIDPAKEYIYKHLAELRNFIFDMSETDYILSIDSDILVSSDVLSKLLEADRNICAGLIYNGYKINPTEPWRYPNIMKFMSDGNIEHIANSYVKNGEKLKESKLAKVDVSGAVILLSKDAYKNTKYAWHEQGEDVGWALDCKQKGFEVWVDYSVFGFHAMDEELLQKHLKGEI